MFEIKKLLREYGLDILILSVCSYILLSNLFNTAISIIGTIVIILINAIVRNRIGVIIILSIVWTLAIVSILRS